MEKIKVHVDLNPADLVASSHDVAKDILRLRLPHDSRKLVITGVRNVSENEWELFVARDVNVHAVLELLATVPSLIVVDAQPSPRPRE